MANAWRRAGVPFFDASWEVDSRILAGDDDDVRLRLCSCLDP